MAPRLATFATWAAWTCATALPHLLAVSAHAPRDDLHACKPIQKRQIAVGSGEGGPPTGATSSASAAGYSCDPNNCKLPNCQCASVAPPGGLAPADTPQFIVFTADDAVQSYTTNAINTFLAHRKNPNGCSPKMTYFVSLNYTNYSMVTDWYVAGNEIADHTMYHVGDPDPLQIDGNLRALNSLSGIPISEIAGFRAPYLNYSIGTMQHLASAGFTYDSSTTSSTPANMTGSDAYWPYTLDNGFANDCLTVDGLCQGKVKLPGMWELPMYGIFDERQVAGVHLMDPWLDSADANAVLGWLQSTFTTHYSGNRQPFGLYTHPILAQGYPGITDPIAQINMVNTFLDWAQNFPNVWIVSNKQMLQWLRAPVPSSQLGSFAPFGCSVPNVGDKICNGLYPNEVGLLQNCPFTDFPFTTCYGCPVEPPSPSNPVPAQAVPTGGGQARFRLPSNCSTPFFDPIGNKCLCSSSSCQFTDQTRPIGNYSSGGTNFIPNESGTKGGKGAGGKTSPYTPFSSDSPRSLTSQGLTLMSIVLVGSWITLNGF